MNYQRKMLNNMNDEIENLNKGGYIGDVDLAPLYAPELTDEDLKETTVEKE